MTLRDASAVLEIDGQDRFVRLAIAEWIKLQEAFDIGPQVIIERFYSNAWKVGDLAVVLRVALEGGGMHPVEAKRTANDTVNGNPLADSLLAVQKILQVGYAGPTDEQLKKSQEASLGTKPEKPNGSTISPTANTDGEASSVPPP